MSGPPGPPLDPQIYRDSLPSANLSKQADMHAKTVTEMSGRAYTEMIIWLFSSTCEQL